jgi:hypothetical protein
MAEQTLLTYKGRPLARQGNTLYYGDMSEQAVVILTVLSSETVGDLPVSGKVQVQLMSTDPTLHMKDRILKKSEQNGLYNALDIGCIWLDRTLGTKQPKA